MNQLNEEIKLCKQTRNHQLEQANAVKTSIAKANPNYKKPNFQTLYLTGARKKASN